jgi:hypothetical protein
MDSFDHYATADFTEKWTSTGIEVTIQFDTDSDPSIQAAGRNSTSCLRFAQSQAANGGGARAAGLTLAPADNVFIWGAAIKYSAFSTICVGADSREYSANFAGANYIVACRNVNDKLWFARVNQDGTISVYRDTGDASCVLLGTTSGALQAGVWAFVEIKVTVHNSAGTVDVRINGTTSLSLTSQNTRGGGSTNAWNNIRMGYMSFQSGAHPFYLYVEDMYVLDGSGSLNNDFLGDVTISALYASGAGSNTGWTASAGSNYQCVDETSPNDDTDYVSTSTVDAKDTYAWNNVAAGAEIKAVQLLSAIRKAAEGPGKVKHVIRSNSTDYDSAEMSIGGTTYSYLRTVHETDPATAVAWTESGFNSAEFGVKKTG